MSASSSTPTSPRASTGASNLSLELEGPRPKYCINPMDQEELENVERYEPGGLRPIHVNDEVCNGRFDVVHKLGQGGFATVWLCRDNREERWCALKIMELAQSSEEGGDLKVMNLFREKGIDRDEAATHHVVVPEEHFWIDGPNGRHLALVTPLLGPPLSWWLEDEKRTFDAMTGLCRQMGKGLQFLHDNGVCHGDFRPGNILLKIRNIDNMTGEELCEILGIPEGIDIGLNSGEEFSPHAPEYLVKPAWWGGAMKEGIVFEEIAIVDFGEAFLEGQPPKFSGIPRSYGAPEIVYNQTPSAASDVWALGASIMEVFGGDFFGSSVMAATSRLESYLGPLPVEYRGQFEKQHRAYLTSRREHQDLCERNLLKQGLSEYVDKSPKTEPSKWVLTESQPLKIFRYDCQERPTPAHILQHPWLKEDGADSGEPEATEELEVAEEDGATEDVEEEGILVFCSAKMPSGVRQTPGSKQPEWNKGDTMPAGVRVDDKFKERLHTYTKLDNIKEGTADEPGVIWACPFGKVPGKAKIEDEDGNEIDLNEDPDIVRERARVVATMAKEQAKELGFPWVIIKGAPHETQTVRDTILHVNIPDEYVADMNHFTVVLTNDLNKLLVAGHIYVEANPKTWIPKGIMKLRVVNGNQRRVIDLFVCETKKDKLERDKKAHEKRQQPTRQGN
ncbi:kinase-like protein [Apiospora phragmitis]|uniref:EKC/KEOPS complex subunit BUD32 n=1 Tax=Apiospora phragmitis TaxID=2905665 RepID=A0ABR1T888_9PEZI